MQGNVIVSVWVLFLILWFGVCTQCFLLYFIFLSFCLNSSLFSFQCDCLSPPWWVSSVSCQLSLCMLAHVGHLACQFVVCYLVYLQPSLLEFLAFVFFGPCLSDCCFFLWFCLPNWTSFDPCLSLPAISLHFRYKIHLLIEQRFLSVSSPPPESQAALWITI